MDLDRIGQTKVRFFELLGGRAGTAYDCILLSRLIYLKRLVGLNGRILELLNQFRAWRSAYFSRPRACPKNRGHRFPQILVMIQEGLRVAIPLKDKTLCVVVKVQLVCKVPVSLVRTNSKHLAARCLNSSSFPWWILSLAIHSSSHPIFACFLPPGQ